jgi:2-hydroxychromene-2-carboxylate isomerase
MQKSVEFFFDVGSPTAYLAYTQLPSLTREVGAKLIYRPMLLGGVFKATGNTSPVSIPAKGKWMMSDLKRWTALYGVSLNMNPHFPINTLPLMRGAVGMQLRDPERFEAYLQVVMESVWVNRKNMSEPQQIAETLAEAGFDAAVFEKLITDEQVKTQLIKNTEEAVSRGVFGAPTFFVDNHMFFGQDRLHFVKAALA